MHLAILTLSRVKRVLPAQSFKAQNGLNSFSELLLLTALQNRSLGRLAWHVLPLELLGFKRLCRKDTVNCVLFSK